MENAGPTLAALAMPMSKLAPEDFADLDDVVRAHWVHELDDAIGASRKARNVIAEGP
jgi:hypothetical protein